MRDGGGEVGWTLRQRLQIIITLALLPVAVVSIFQGLARVRIDIADVRERLVQSARSLALDDEDLLAGGDEVLRAVRSLSDVRSVTPNCDSVLADTLIGVRYYSNLSRITANGVVVCSAMALARGQNVANDTVFKAIKSSMSMQVSNELTSPVTGQKEILAMLALHNPDGSFDGAVAISLDVHWIDFMLRSSNLPPGAVAVIYDRSGKIIATTNRQFGAAIVRAALKAGASRQVGVAYNQQGLRWRYGKILLTGNSIAVAFAMEEARLFAPTYLHVGLDFALPILMIGFAWFAIWLATDRQITRWINYLRRFALAYRSGHYTIRPDLSQAPTEFKLLGDAMSEMAQGIYDRDRRLRESVEAKTLLIREIHHRVKNNLQIVMSLLSIQANQVMDYHAKDALLQAQTRINALALVHRILNEVEDQSTLDVRQLLSELSQQIAGGMSNDKVRVELDVPSHVVAGSVAVVLALFTVEALTNIFKHAFPGDREGVVRLSLTRLTDGNLRLAVSDNGMGFSADDTGKNLGSRLIKTFALQLQGDCQIHSVPGRGTVVELTFPDPARSQPSAVHS